MSYGFDNNDDISTMSLIPKFAQLSFTYYLSLYCSNLRNFCEFLNWFLIAHFLFWVYGWQILGIINQRFRWMQINPFPLSIKTYTYHMHHVTIYSSAVMTCNFQYLAISFFVTTTFNEHPVMGRNGWTYKDVSDINFVRFFKLFAPVLKIFCTSFNYFLPMIEEMFFFLAF